MAIALTLTIIAITAVTGLLTSTPFVLAAAISFCNLKFHCMSHIFIPTPRQIPRVDNHLNIIHLYFESHNLIYKDQHQY